jgi:hypothetical protein
MSTGSVLGAHSQTPGSWRFLIVGGGGDDVVDVVVTLLHGAHGPVPLWGSD